MKEYIVTKISEYDGSIDIQIFDHGEKLGENYQMAYKAYMDLKEKHKGYTIILSETIIKTEP